MGPAGCRVPSAASRKADKVTVKRIASRFFAAKAAEQIHEAALALLTDPGVRFEHDGIAARLRQAGAQGMIALAPVVDAGAVP